MIVVVSMRLCLMTSTDSNAMTLCAVAVRDCVPGGQTRSAEEKYWRPELFIFLLSFRHFLSSEVGPHERVFRGCEGR